MKRFLNILLYILVGGVILVIATIIIASKSLPDGEKGVAAELFADRMLAAVNEPAWSSLRYVAWTFAGKHHYVWDKWYHIAEIRWDKTRVLLNINARDGKVWRDGVRLEGEDKREVVARALKYWNNDSFWLNPVVKIRDEGTERRLVKLDDGGQGLLVTYSQGGSTPGDSFLWKVNEEGLPVEWRMWARILPVKGLSASWEEWVSLDGAMVSTRHEIGPVTVRITDARSGDHHSDLGLTKDPFVDL